VAADAPVFVWARYVLHQPTLLVDLGSEVPLRHHTVHTVIDLVDRLDPELLVPCPAKSLGGSGRRAAVLPWGASEPREAAAASPARAGSWRWC
jgi:hypothetical protein